GISAHKETRLMDITAIHVLSPNAPGLQPTKEKGIKHTYTNKEDGCSGENLSLVDFTDSELRKTIPGIIIDRTDLTGKYDIQVTYKRDNEGCPTRDSLTQGMREKMGLDLVPGCEPLEVLVVECKTTATQPTASTPVPLLEFRWVAADTEHGRAEQVPWLKTTSVARLPGAPEPWLLKDTLLTEKDVLSASVAHDPQEVDPYGVSLTFKPDAQVRFADATEKGVNKQLAIVINGKVACTPTVKSRVTGGAVIKGDFTQAEAAALVANIRARGNALNNQGQTVPLPVPAWADNLENWKSDSSVLEKLPPALVLRPTRFAQRDGRNFESNGQWISPNVLLGTLISDVYDVDLEHMIIPDDLKKSSIQCYQ
ncbi:TPA: hypothetical protein DDW35_11405, partial [Candidatus Sumerlaeota bacterium]|nr:hypothetical protein [Candidatus Sumerlaeota bacterium]